jgi:hypothetical protein
MERIIYHWFLVICVVGGVALFVSMPESTPISSLLVSFGTSGLSVEQQIDKEKLEFEMQRQLKELSEEKQRIEPNRKMERPNLQRPSFLSGGMRA